MIRERSSMLRYTYIVLLILASIITFHHSMQQTRRYELADY